MEVERKIRKVGNSLGVLLPSSMLKEIGVKDGDTVYISMGNDGEIVIRNTEQKKNNEKFKKQVIAIIDEYMENKE
ncbi:putative addiction module antidote [Peribacillus asahii]|uniref:Putative addiction module antidote n=1 Tax=Peribacillus asahii TaxID=228899 RepID=A0A3Q9RP86_9BACI|nr:AbrB/MazE/SpoVT family DNA-binding domain-containing protein [Peribacillus asahii]AZV43656.1 putative addiction module antidote [Peribacillus asahii]